MNNGTPKLASIDDLSTWLSAYKEACSHRDEWSEIANKAKEQISQALEAHDAEVGTINGVPAVRYTPVTTSRLDTKRLRREHPDLVEEFSVTSHTRRFTVVDQGAS